MTNCILENDIIKKESEEEKSSNESSNRKNHLSTPDKDKIAQKLTTDCMARPSFIDINREFLETQVFNYANHLSDDESEEEVTEV